MDSAHVTPKVKLCMHTIIKPVAPTVRLVKVPFWAFFGPDIKTEMGVVIYMYLKHSPDYIDSKYIWFHGLTPKVQVFLLKYHFWHF